MLIFNIIIEIRVVLSGIEPESKASETLILSIVLQDQNGANVIRKP